MHNAFKNILRMRIPVCSNIQLCCSFDRNFNRFNRSIMGKQIVLCSTKVFLLEFNVYQQIVYIMDFSSVMKKRKEKSKHQLRPLQFLRRKRKTTTQIQLKYWLWNNIVYFEFSSCMIQQGYPQFISCWPFFLSLFGYRNALTCTMLADGCKL